MLTEDFWRSLPKKTLVEYEWVDIQSDSVGDVDKAAVAYRRSLGWFWEYKVDSRGTPVVVFALTSDSDGTHNQSGWDCLPAFNVIAVEVHKRPKKPRAKKAPKENE